MKTRLTIHSSGNVLTVHLHSTAVGRSIHASLSGFSLYALVDGLLWWTINRKLESLVAICQTTPAPTHRDDAMRWGQALYSGEELVMHVFTTPFYEADEQRQERIVLAVERYLPKLKELCKHGAHASTVADELLELEALCTLLADRIRHTGEGKHGIDHITTYTTDHEAAA